MKKIKVVLLWVLGIAGFIIFVKMNLLSQTGKCSSLQKTALSEIEKLKICATDYECTFLRLSCPFDCFTPINSKYTNQALTHVNKYNKECMMVCPLCPKKVNQALKCIEGKCTAVEVGI